MDYCLFCSCVSGKEQRVHIVYQDNLVLAMMPPGQANPGHVLIMPKAHIERLAEMSEETGMHLFRIAMRLQRAIEKSGIKCEGTYLDLAEGAGAFQIGTHIYLNLVPRFRWDRYYVKAVIDRPYADPDALLRTLVEDRIRRWRGESEDTHADEVSLEELDELAERIRDSYTAIWSDSQRLQIGKETE